jgi:hypothetical protein
MSLSEPHTSGELKKRVAGDSLLSSTGGTGVARMVGTAFIRKEILK